MNKEQRIKKNELSDMVFTQDIIKTNPETVTRILQKLYQYYKLSKFEYCVFIFRHGLLNNRCKPQSFSQIAKEFGASVEEVLTAYNRTLKLISKSLVESSFNLDLAL